MLPLVAQVERPRLVVDLGAGTGLSTRVWAERAAGVVGIEANSSMLERAHSGNDRPTSVTSRLSLLPTGLPSGEADIVACAQAFHWMEPAPALTEAARLLVLAAFSPPTTTTYRRWRNRKSTTPSPLSSPPASPRASDSASRPGPRPRRRSAASTRSAMAAISVSPANSSATVPTRRAPSASSDSPRASADPRALFNGQAPEVEECFARLREVAHSVLGDRVWPMVVCYRIRVGVK